MTTKRLVEDLLELSAQHIGGESIEEPNDLKGRGLYFFLGDDEDGVEITHEIGNPELAARRLRELADKLRAHADKIVYQHNLRTAGWT